MKRSLLLAAALAAALPFSAAAHKAWLRPSQTVIAVDPKLRKESKGTVTLK